MNRFNVLLSSILAVLLVAGFAVGLYVRELGRIERHRYYAEIAAQQGAEVTITIPEGWRREQIAALLQENGISAADDFLQVTDDDEGRLFPDTYRFFPLTEAREVRRRLLDNYQNKVAATSNVSRDELIIASIVEREAKNDEERAAIAGVYWNRYRAGFALTADPTVQYGRDSNELETLLKKAVSKSERNRIIIDYPYWGTITRDDYTGVESLFNTYTNAGLPPAPICNPGLASITAAQNPANHDYYYFLHGRDGQIVFGRTLEEHNSNKARYL